MRTSRMLYMANVLEKGLMAPTVGLDQARFSSGNYEKCGRPIGVSETYGPHCLTSCCVAGHTYIVAYGLEKYFKACSFTVEQEARRILGLDAQQAESLFYSCHLKTPEKLAKLMRDMVRRYRNRRSAR